jgi:uncharacterized protein (TIGR03435 family)
MSTVYLMRRLACGVIFGTMAWAQSPSFESVSIKPTKVRQLGAHREPVHTTANSITLPYAAVEECIALAYGIQTFQLTGAELRPDRYEIVATTARPTSRTELYRMLQTVLAERFHLKFHRESKTMEVFALEQNATPVRREQSEGSGDPVIDLSPTTIVFDHYSMSQFAALLSDSTEHHVVDRTGLAGEYKFKIDIARYMNNAIVSVNGFAGEGAVFDAALPEQLGLKLQRTKAEMEVLVVDHIEKPDAN